VFTRRTERTSEYANLIALEVSRNFTRDDCSDAVHRGRLTEFSRRVAALHAGFHIPGGGGICAAVDDPR
jgi:hypothetical protein